MSRADIYYWKCDRPAAFHGTQMRRDVDAQSAARLREALRRHFAASSVELSPAQSQGNHLTWNADVDGVAMFIRVEDGPEKDDHLEVESAVLEQVRATGVPTPRVHGTDVRRTKVPFAWQALERIEHPALNHWYKQGQLDVAQVAFELGVAVAKWQSVRPSCYGPFDATVWRDARSLSGYHASYEDYFHLRLDQHLRFLEDREFLPRDQRREIERAVASHHALLRIEGGCLVHKDLALWNVLGSETHIAAFIDFDDAISGDPLDDLSLLACFHDAAFLRQAFVGYETIRAFPNEHRRRFWLHLLRNMIVKAVIRVGAGYFERDAGFFLIGAGSNGADLKDFTQQRLALALHSLATDADLSIL